MTYKRHWLLSWGGTIGNGKDVWANNIRMTNDETGQPDSVPGSTLESMLDDYVSDIRTFMTSAGANIVGGTTCTWVKFNEIGPDGLYVNKTLTHARYLNGTGALAPFSGASTSYCPTFQSVAVTLTTSQARGPGSKGRFFLPGCAPTLNFDGVIAPASQTAIATAAAAFLTALGDEAGVDVTNMRPAVVSNVGSPGPANVVTGVAVGNVPDVQRRRKNNIIETYAKATVS